MIITQFNFKQNGVFNTHCIITRGHLKALVSQGLGTPAHMQQPLPLSPIPELQVWSVVGPGSNRGSAAPGLAAPTFPLSKPHTSRYYSPIIVQETEEWRRIPSGSAQRPKITDLRGQNRTSHHRAAGLYQAVFQNSLENPQSSYIALPREAHLHITSISPGPCCDCSNLTLQTAVLPISRNATENARREKLGAPGRNRLTQIRINGPILSPQI